MVGTIEGWYATGCETDAEFIGTTRNARAGAPT
jgi:hypothetical protein